MDSLIEKLDKLVLDADFAPFLAVLKGARNGAVYGAKIRFPHALVMIFLFRSGSIREKAWLVFKATRQHARNLSLFATIYKSTMIALKYIGPNGWGKEGPYDTFVAGLLGGYLVFGKSRGSVSKQIVIYIFARVMLAMAKMSVEPGTHRLSHLITPEARDKIYANAWPAFASLSWAFVMYIFRWHPAAIQSSLRSSMTYIYADSDHWDSLRTLLIHNK
ncbi:peroxisomal protein [Histoplasma capsulatum var. duboisii H88]|uniref:Peroxisomal membrane protein n=1 Tax=Ajellomyces capsulatus (strain H88) TaxID=544711 RepID=F0UED7_AJEC8|nr:peroxisomal protein [Histoplasma capsulatum var. duboisii H88]QSS55439.1 peroxisomal membrane protein [Histoplasma capsulatum var. duboisii H88]